MLASLLDGNDGSLSMTLGLGDPSGYSLSMGEAKLILGRQIAEPSLYKNAGTAPLAARLPDRSGGLGDSPGGGDGSGSGSSGGEASDAGGTEGSGNDGSNGDG